MGSVIEENGKIDVEICEHIEKEGRIFNSLKATEWGNIFPRTRSCK